MPRTDIIRRCRAARRLHLTNLLPPVDQRIATTPIAQPPHVDSHPRLGLRTYRRPADFPLSPDYEVVTHITGGTLIQELTRTMLQDLERWNTKPGRKPLLLRGARQTGKTWIVNAFGASHFEHVARIDFMRDADARALFDGNLTANSSEHACRNSRSVAQYARGLVHRHRAYQGSYTVSEYLTELRHPDPSPSSPIRKRKSGTHRRGVSRWGEESAS